MKKEVRTNREEYVVIAGAGISMAAPANLPSWWQYNKKIVDEIKKQACDFCPEAVEWINKIDIGENGIAVQCLSELIVNEGAGDSYFTLLELLNAKNPNANHFALAELARKGCISAIVTTNFDTLIETAFMSEAVPIYTIVNENTYYESSRWNTCKLFKIHGTVDSYNSLIDTVRQKAMGLNSWKRFSLKQVFLVEIL